MKTRTMLAVGAALVVCGCAPSEKGAGNGERACAADKGAQEVKVIRVDPGEE